jgi:predicted transport protein
MEKALIDAANEAEMRERAQRQDVTKVPMSPTARQLFDVLRSQVLAIDSDIIEIAEQKSVSYHGPSFFLEVIPRKNRIGLLVALDFNEVEDTSGLAEDTSQWKFITHAAYEGGVYVNIDDVAAIEKAVPMLRLAHELEKT